jgi:CO/xanthine dehydrogenase Mo-binding subunit
LARRKLSRILDIPEDRVRVFKPRVGGGFGNKQEVLCEDLCAFAALRLRRPVTWEFSRYEEFVATNTRHAMKIRVRAAGSRTDGLTALELRFRVNAGAYGNHSFDVLECAGFEAMSLYDCPHKSVHGRAVYTNTVPGGAFRGYGASQTICAVESAVDELARRLGVDAAAFRRRGLLPAGAPIYVADWEDPDHIVGSSELDSCMTHVHTRLAELRSEAAPPGDDLTAVSEGVAVGEQESRRLPHSPDPTAPDGEWLYGTGMAISTVAGGLAKIHHSGARITLREERFEVVTSTADIGTGSDTTLAQLAAESLGVGFEAITVRAGDTADAPEDSGAYASATATIGGKAVTLAAEKLKARLQSFAAEAMAEELGTGHEAELFVADGSVTGPAGSVSMAELSRRAAEGGIELAETVESFAYNQVPMSYAAVGALLRVHRRTGRLEVLHLVQAIDAGRIINPRIARGQAEGGAMQGVALAISEELVVGAAGAVDNPAFRDYRVPAVSESPEIETAFFEASDPDGPHGAKGLGELTTNAAPGAIANAVRDALGVRIASLPITAEKCWAALVSATETETTTETETAPEAETGKERSQ